MYIQIQDKQNVSVHLFHSVACGMPHTCNALGGIYDLCHISIGVISNVCCNHKYCTFIVTSTMTYTYFKLVYRDSVLPVCVCVQDWLVMLFSIIFVSALEINVLYLL